MLQTKVCIRSGLKFTTDNTRLRVHPQISKWTTLKDVDTRYKATNVIAKGQKEGWDSIEKFEEEIQKAIAPEPEYNLSCSGGNTGNGYKKGWVARITGACEHYGYKRQFVSAVLTDGRHSFFNLTEDGIYQACSYSAKGNDHKSWYKVENGELKQIDESEAIAIVGEPGKPQPEIIPEGCIKFDAGGKYLGDTGSVILHNEQYYKVSKIHVEQWWEDIDGISGKYPKRPYEDISHEWNEYIYYLLPATEEEITEQKAKVDTPRPKSARIL